MDRVIGRPLRTSATQTWPMTIDRFAEDRPCEVMLLSSRKAGSGIGRDEVPKLIELLRGRAIPVRQFDSVDLLSRRLSEIRAESIPVVVAAGGDGTLSLAAGVVDPDVPIVPLPLGTENLLARNFGFRAEAEQVVRTIQSGSPRKIDAATANGRTFLIMATCGFDAEVVRAMHLTRRGHIRRSSYFFPILRAMKNYRFPTIRVTVDGRNIEGCWAMVFNLPRYAGGLNIAPDAVCDDGQLDVVVFRGGSILSGLKYVTGIWTGRHRSFRDVVQVRGESITLESDDRIPLQLDGDYAGQLPVRIQVAARRIQLLLPVAESPSR